jgi:hypothetical protein
MPFGSDTVRLITYVDGPIAGELGTFQQVPSYTDAPGCRHRPLTFTEKVEMNFDVATELWKSTVPIGEYSGTLRNAILAAKPESEIEVDGTKYAIVGGVQPFKDFTTWFKATIISKKQTG